MDSSHLAPGGLDGAKKQRAIHDARDMSEFIKRSAERAGSAIPPYDFLELIGKGGSGRVYKCRKQADGELVAVKIINTDEIDYAQHALDKDDTIRDFKKEVSILHQLKDSNAKNVNMIHDAFPFQEQLWIICDYCTGGSVRTLLRARPSAGTGLEEHYIIAIARELALAMKSVHDIGIIHRDIKCTNVYVNERGDIQLGDFGIVGVTDESTSKRRTIIGTPHYMPPELHLPSDGNQAPQAYGKEIDVWSYGCSVYEMATGQPPHAHVTSMSELNHQVLQNAPRLESDSYSNELKDFIAFCLTKNPQDRPTAEQILTHPYIANTQKRYPTANLVRLIERYKLWEVGGGQRVSLWMPGGAPDVPSVTDAAEEEQEGDDWNFSTSDDFDEAFGKRYSQMIENEGQGELPRELILPSLQTQDLSSPYQHHIQRHEERSANRGEVSLQRLWNTDSAPYELHEPVEMFGRDDLPLRSAQSAPVRESSVMIDLDEGAIDEAATSFHFDFGDSDMPTLRARRSHLSMREEQDDEPYHYGQSEDDLKRATMEWTFPSRNRATMDWTFPSATAGPVSSLDLATPEQDDDSPQDLRPALKHTMTAPVGQFGDYLHTARPPMSHPAAMERSSMASLIDLDASFADPVEAPRPSTAGSATGSTMTDMTSGNPFDLEEDPGREENSMNRQSYHKQWQSEGGQGIKRNSRKSVPMHTRGSSLSSTDSELDHMTRSESDVFDGNFNTRRRSSMRRPLHLQTASDTTDTDSEWPTFHSSPSAFARPRDKNQAPDSRRPSDVASVARSSRVNSYGKLEGSRGKQPEVDFPALVAPHPECLLEDAHPHVVVAELSRLLDDFADGLSATVGVMEQFSGLFDRDDMLDRDHGLRDDDPALEGGDELR